MMRSEGGINLQSGRHMFDNGHGTDSRDKKLFNEKGHGLKCLICHLVNGVHGNALVYSCHKRRDGAIERFVVRFGPGVGSDLV